MSPQVCYNEITCIYMYIHSKTCIQEPIMDSVLYQESIVIGTGNFRLLAGAICTLHIYEITASAYSVCTEKYTELKLNPSCIMGPV